MPSDPNVKKSRRAISVGEMLRSVNSLESLHEILAAISREHSQWSRTQVLHYLPQKFHSRAAEYFEGERWRTASEQPRVPEGVESVPLAEILKRINSNSETTSARPSGSSSSAHVATADRIRTANQIHALPVYAGPGSNHEAISGMIRALRDEIDEVNRRAPKLFRLRDGVCVDGSGGRFTYQFTWSSEPDPHIPGTLMVGAKQYPARVGAQAADSDIRFTIETDAYLGVNVPLARFQIDPTFLLTLAHEQMLHELTERQHEVVSHIDRLLSPPNSRPSQTLPHAVTAQLNPEQANAVSVGLQNDRSYIWGPPGTGKTTTLGALVAALVSAGKRVLVVSPYNVAVDAAALTAAVHNYSDGAIVRIGRVSEEVRRAGIDLETQLERLAASNGTLLAARQLLAALGVARSADIAPPMSVRACLDELGAYLVKSRAAALDPQIGQVICAISALRSQFRAPESEILKGARVVASTIALHMVLSELRNLPFDHVIVDEASVVRPPEAVLLSLRARAPMTFFGDPKQLPPIVVSTSEVARKWLGRNPFALAGIGRPSDAIGACVLLEEQHRMAPPICSLVSDLFYEGRLRNGARAPKSGQIVLIDTSNTAARATSKMIKLSTSKENQLHRTIVADVVRAILDCEKEAAVLVISPFVAQTRAYRREPTTARLARGIRFETIHASQGSERDTVVIDLVLAGSLTRGGRSRMFDDDRNSHLANLLNVAISRARHRLVIVGYHSLLRSAYSKGLLDNLWAAACARGALVEVPSDLRCRDLFRSALRY